MTDFGFVDDDSDVSLDWKSIHRSLIQNFEMDDALTFPPIQYDYDGDDLILVGLRSFGGVWKGSFEEVDGNVYEYQIATMSDRVAPNITIPKDTLLGETISGFGESDLARFRELIAIATVEKAAREQQELFEQLRREEERRAEEQNQREREYKRRLEWLQKAEEHRKQEAEAEAERSKREMAEKEYLRQLDELGLELEREWISSRKVLSEIPFSGVAPALEELMPLTLSLHDLLNGYIDHQHRLTRVRQMIGQVRRLQPIPRTSSSAYLPVSSAFRSLGEPQCAVVIGRYLDSLHFTPIAASYVGALADLGCLHQANSVCERYWIEKDVMEKPEYLANAYLRVSKLMNNDSAQERIRSWAETNGHKLGGNLDTSGLSETSREIRLQALRRVYPDVW